MTAVSGGRWSVVGVLLLLGAQGFLPVPAAAVLSHLDAGRAAAKVGNWEAAADAAADALFENPGSEEARVLLRAAADQALAKRTDRVQLERMRILYELGLRRDPPVEPAQPAITAPPPMVKYGPPTLTVPQAARKPRRRVVQVKVEEPVEEVVKATTPADREMARFLYFQGLKAYADNELDEAKQAWQKALQLDPQMERSRSALERIEKSRRKP